MASRLAPTNPAVGQASASRRLSGQKASVRRMAVVAHAQDGEGVMSKAAAGLAGLALAGQLLVSPAANALELSKPSGFEYSGSAIENPAVTNRDARLAEQPSPPAAPASERGNPEIGSLTAKNVGGGSGIGSSSVAKSIGGAATDAQTNLQQGVSKIKSNVRGANENAKSQLPDAKSLAGAANEKLQDAGGSLPNLPSPGKAVEKVKSAVKGLPLGHITYVGFGYNGSAIENPSLPEREERVAQQASPPAAPSAARGPQSVLSRYPSKSVGNRSPDTPTGIESGVNTLKSKASGAKNLAGAVKSKLPDASDVAGAARSKLPDAKNLAGAAKDKLEDAADNLPSLPSAGKAVNKIKGLATGGLSMAEVQPTYVGFFGGNSSAPTQGNIDNPSVTDRDARKAQQPSPPAAGFSGAKSSAKSVGNQSSTSTSTSELGTKAGSEIKDTVNDVKNKVEDKLPGGGLSGISGALKNLAGGASDKLDDAAQAGKGKIEGGLDAVKDKAPSGFNVKNLASSASDKAESAVDAVKDKAPSGFNLKNLASSASDKAESAADAVKDKAPSGFSLKNLASSASDKAESAADAVKDKAPSGFSLKNLASGASDKAENAVDSIKDKAPSGVNLKSVASGASNKAENAVDAIKDKASGFNIKSVGDALKNEAAAEADTVKAKTSNPLKSVAGAADDAKSKLEGGLDGAKDKLGSSGDLLKGKASSASSGPKTITNPGSPATTGAAENGMEGVRDEGTADPDGAWGRGRPNPGNIFQSGANLNTPEVTK